MRNRLYELITTGRSGAGLPRSGRTGRLRGAREIDIEVANHHRSPRVPATVTPRSTRFS
ncbi:MAG: hypothetical protein JWM47_2072 [Acidimicrobiales bacterium]|nr:hypothetical protein [Acidimicrobiales bacterium]